MASVAAAAAKGAHLRPAALLWPRRFIWRLWHVPFQLSGIQHIDGISPTRLALTLPIGIAAAGLIIGWLWLRTESIWIVSLAHGALNSWGQYALKYMKESVNPTADARAGGAGGLAMLLVGILLLWRCVPQPRLQSHSLPLSEPFERRVRSS